MSLKLYMVTAGSKYLHEKWDIYDSFVVCCESKEEARKTHPSLGPAAIFDDEQMCWVQTNGMKIGLSTDKHNLLAGWIYGKDIHDGLKVEFLGKAKKTLEKGVIITSYNAG